MSVTIALVSTDRAQVTHLAQLTDIAQELKAHGKGIPGSVLVGERRHHIEALAARRGTARGVGRAGMSRRSINQGPSQSELHMRGELDRARRELAKLKKGTVAAGVAAAAEAAAASTEAAAAAAAAADAAASAPAAAADRPRRSRRCAGTWRSSPPRASA